MAASRSSPALDRLTTGLAAELHGSGVSVNALGTSGLVLTPGVAVVSPHTPQNATVEPDDAMADAAVVLCGTPPGRVTGRIVQHGTARPAAPGRALGLVAHVLIDRNEREWLMKVTVDPDLCQGHARCWEICPEVFSLDDVGHAAVAVGVVPAGLEPEVAKAVSNRPERAITVS
jgi:ferredoxin